MTTDESNQQGQTHEVRASYFRASHLLKSGGDTLYVDVASGHEIENTIAAIEARLDGLAR